VTLRLRRYRVTRAEVERHFDGPGHRVTQDHLRVALVLDPEAGRELLGLLRPLAAGVPHAEPVAVQVLDALLRGDPVARERLGVEPGDLVQRSANAQIEQQLRCPPNVPRGVAVRAGT
jgi:hypothetical protein